MQVLNVHGAVVASGELCMHGAVACAEMCMEQLHVHVIRM